MKLKKMLTLILTLVTVFTLFAGCGSKTVEESEKPVAESKDPVAESKEVDLETIKIGHICDLTGVQAQNGASSKQALEFAVEFLGGEFAGRKVEIIVGDAMNDSSVAVDLAKKMVEEDKVVAIFGPTQIGQKSAVAEYMKEAGIPLIFYNPTPLYMLGNNDWVVGAGGSTMQMPTSMADYAYNELGYRTIHTVSMDNSGNRALIDPFSEAFEKLGGTVVSQVWAPIPCSDWAPYLVVLEDVDAIGAWASGSDAISLWSAWYDLGVSERIPMFAAAMHGGFTDSYVPSALSNMNPPAAEALMGAVAPIMYVYDIDNPENEAFVKAWVEKYGQRPTDGNPGIIAQAVYLFKAAVEALDGDTDPAKLMSAMFAADVTGPEGRMFFDGSNVATLDIYIAEVVKLDDGYNYETIKIYKNVPPAGFTN